MAPGLQAATKSGQKRMTRSRSYVVLVDFVMSGHHQAWLLQFARSFLNAGCGVHCLCPEPDWMVREIARVAPGAPFTAGFVGRPRLPRIPFPRLRNAAEALLRWRATARAIKSKPGLVFFAMFDGLFEFGVTPRLVDWLFPHPWAALYFHPGYERTKGNPRRPRSDSCLRARNCRAVAVLDHGAAEGLRRYLVSKPVIPFPDFIIPSEKSPSAPWIEEIRARAGDRSVVVSAGALTQRKGIATLLRLARRPDVTEFFFVFAGRFGRDTFTPEEQALWEEALARPPENCLLRFGKIETDSAFDQLIAASDIVYAAYHDFRHSSNLIGKAARFRRPIVVSRGYCMEEWVRRFSLGAVVEERNEEESLAALRALRREPDAPRDFEGYMREHSLERFEEQLGALLAAAE